MEIKRRIYMHKMITIAAILLLSIFVSASSAAPKLAFQHSYFDFGYAPQEAKLTHTFWIKSVGDEDLKITEVNTGCSCTKAPLTKKIIAPGDSTELSVTFSTGRYKNRVLKKPTIFSNEGTEGRSATIIANLFVNPDSTGPLFIKPYIISLPMGEGTSKTYAEFNIRNGSDKELELTMVDLPEEFFTVELPKTIAPNGEARGYIQLAAKGVKNAFEKSFTFEINNKEKTRYSLCVSRLIDSEMLKLKEPIRQPSD
jgi:hypothetical protein